MQVDDAEFWLDALEEQIIPPGLPLNQTQSSGHPLCKAVLPSPSAKAGGPSLMALSQKMNVQHLLRLLLYMVACQVTMVSLVLIWRFPAAFAVSAALVWLATVESQQRAKMSASAHQLAMHAQRHAVHAWSTVSRSWCCCWSTAAALATLLWRFKARTWPCVSAAVRFSAAHADSAWASTAPLWASLCLFSSSWSCAHSTAASACTIDGISHITWSLSWQAAVCTGSAAQQTCDAVWSVLCQALVITGAVVLTSAVIGLSTLLAAGFIAITIASAAAALCLVWIAAAACLVTDTARAVAPVVKTTASSSVSACLNRLTHAFLLSVTAIKDGSTSVPAATGHCVCFLHFKASQCSRSAVGAMQRALAKLQRQQPGHVLMVLMALILSSCAVYDACIFDLAPVNLMLYDLHKTGVQQQGPSKGLMVVMGLHLCRHAQHSPPDACALGRLLLQKGPALLGFLALAACGLLSAGYYLSLALEEPRHPPSPSRSRLVRSLASTCDWALAGVCEVCDILGKLTEVLWQSLFCHT